MAYFISELLCEARSNLDLALNSRNEWQDKVAMLQKTASTLFWIHWLYLSMNLGDNCHVQELTKTTDETAETFNQKVTQNILQMLDTVQRFGGKYFNWFRKMNDVAYRKGTIEPNENDHCVNVVHGQVDRFVAVHWCSSSPSFYSSGIQPATETAITSILEMDKSLQGLQISKSFFVFVASSHRR